MEDIKSPTIYDVALEAYDMAKAVMGHNSAIARGEEITSADGSSLQVSYIPDVAAYVMSTYGDSSKVRDAIAAAREFVETQEREGVK